MVPRSKQNIIPCVRLRRSFNIGRLIERNPPPPSLKTPGSSIHLCKNRNKN